MTQVLTNHFDAVISVLLSDPFNDWEQWRAVETGRDSLCQPRDLHDSLDEFRGKFDVAIVDHMSYVGHKLMRDVNKGDVGATRGFQRCLTRWCEMPYFTRTPEPITHSELNAVFFRYPWFFYLLFTDPAL